MRYFTEVNTFAATTAVTGDSDGHALFIWIDWGTDWWVLTTLKQNPHVGHRWAVLGQNMYTWFEKSKVRGSIQLKEKVNIGLIRFCLYSLFGISQKIEQGSEISLVWRIMWNFIFLNRKVPNWDVIFYHYI